MRNIWQRAFDDFGGEKARCGNRDKRERQCPAIIHVGAPSTAEALDLAKHAESAGADAIGAIPPYY